MRSTVVHSEHESSLFPCPLCGQGEPRFAGVCGTCAEKVMEAWHGPATEDEFEAWWKLYPRKVGKDAAREKYRKARKRVSAEALTQALRHYVATVSEKDREFIAHPATWLNQGRWQDEQEPYDAGPKATEGDMMRRNVETFIRSGWWPASGIWGPRPDEPDAEPRVRRMYEEATCQTTA